MMFDYLDIGEVRFNSSYPITATTKAFDIVPDPRPIDADLDKVAIGWDPRSMACLWQQWSAGSVSPASPELQSSCSTLPHHSVVNTLRSHLAPVLWSRCRGRKLVGARAGRREVFGTGMAIQTQIRRKSRRGHPFRYLGFGSFPPTRLARFRMMSSRISGGK